MKKMLWWKHARAPLVAFAVIATFLSFSTTDVTIARALFFDSHGGQWIGASNWWVNDFVHTGGRWAVRVLVLASTCLWIAGSVDASLSAMRRAAAYFTLSVVLSVGIVGLLKTLTNVDCPWDLNLFGGQYPCVHLFGHRPAALRQAQCFPAAHASSGYALMASYFVFRERSSMYAKCGLLFGIGTGLVFGLAQQSRGAHFISHDVWSAMITWLVALTVYTFGFSARLWRVSAARDAVSLKASGCQQSGHCERQQAVDIDVRDT
jgi:membrane-associated PAP2 superfamily phosphatase